MIPAVSRHLPLFIACEATFNEVRPLIRNAIALEVTEAGLHIHSE